MILRQSSASYPLLFKLVLSSDHATPATGKTPTVTISKNGGAFAAPSGAVTEIANGWYKVAGNATDTNTLGPLILSATAASCDQADERFEVGLAPKLASDALDDIAITAPSAPATTFPGMVIQLWRRFFKKVTLTSTQLKTYADDGTTVATTQTVSNDGSTQTQGAAT
jgi:hypothetical protein